MGLIQIQQCPKVRLAARNCHEELLRKDSYESLLVPAISSLRSFDIAWLRISAGCSAYGSVADFRRRPFSSGKSTSFCASFTLSMNEPPPCRLLGWPLSENGCILLTNFQPTVQPHPGVLCDLREL